MFENREKHLALEAALTSAHLSSDFSALPSFLFSAQKKKKPLHMKTARLASSHVYY